MKRPLIALLLLAAATNVSAGECRATVRPLLLDATPDSEALAAVRATCEREAEAGHADARYQPALFTSASRVKYFGSWEEGTK